MLWSILGKDQSIALRELLGNQNSDRVIAIVGGAMLDNALRESLKQRLRPAAETDINECLFRPDGPLASTQSKIHLAYQLYALETIERNAMAAIAQIRDIFVHRLDATFDFSEQNMSRAFSNLILHKSSAYYFDPQTMRSSTYKIEEVNSRLDMFTVNLKISLTHLVRDMRKHRQNSNIPA